MLLAAYVVVCVCAAAVSVGSDASVNYCGARVCGNTDAHTFCQYPEGPSPQCVGYISAELTTEEKSRVIARLNRRRNEAAAGRLRDLTSAGNMLKLRWVEELAREAQRWADQCRPPQVLEEHDACRDLYSVPVGQCVASVVGEAPGLRVESMADIWYMQNMHYKGNATMYIPASSNSSFYGDFAQIMWAQSYMVGCGRSRFMIPWQGRLRSVERLVCNIAPRGPPPSHPLWSPSAPATLCPPRSKRDVVLNALCDIPETVRALQEALDRMERDMATERSTERQGKVRRELRDFTSAETSEVRAEPSISAEEQKFANDLLKAEIERNRTLQRGPMYNMVMKYMPYLKQYEGQLLPEGASKASRLFPSLILVLSFCV